MLTSFIPVPLEIIGFVALNTRFALAASMVQTICFLSSQQSNAGVGSVRARFATLSSSDFFARAFRFPI